MKIKNDFREVQYEQNNDEIIINGDFKVKVEKSPFAHELYKIGQNNKIEDEWAMNYLGGNTTLCRMLTETKIYFLLYKAPYFGSLALDVLCYEPKYELKPHYMLYKKKGNIDFIYDKETKKILMYDDGKLIKKTSVYIKDSITKIFDQPINKIEELKASVEKNEEYFRQNITKMSEMYHRPLENINWLKKHYTNYKGGKNKLQKINSN